MVDADLFAGALKHSAIVSSRNANNRERCGATAPSAHAAIGLIVYGEKLPFATVRNGPIPGADCLRRLPAKTGRRIAQMRARKQPFVA